MRMDGNALARTGLWAAIVAAAAGIVAWVGLHSRPLGGELQLLRAREAELVAERARVWDAFRTEVRQWEAGGRAGTQPVLPQFPQTADEELARVRGRLTELAP